MAVHLSNLNLNGNELQNYVVQPLATAPSGKTGLKFFNTSSGRESIYNGSKWLESAYMTDLEGITSANTAIDNRLKAIEAYFSTEADSDTIINKWNEIVTFLNATEGTTLAGLLAAYVPTTRKVSAGTGLTGGGALSADVTLSLATSGVTAGTYTKVTVDAYGRVTSGSTPTTLAGYSIGNAYTKTEVDNLISGVAESATKVSIKDLLTSGTKIATLTIDSTDYSIYAPSAGAKKYAGTITKGTATSYAITHSLGTRDVIVQVYDPTTYEQVMVDVTMTDTNKVTLTFASAPTQNYKVVVIG